MTTLRQYVARLEAQINDGTALRSKLQQELSAARVDAETMRREIDAHAEQRREIDRARSVVQHKELELQKLTDTLADLRARADAAAADRAALLAKLADAEKREKKARADAAHARSAPPPPPPPPQQPQPQPQQAAVEDDSLPPFNLHDRLAVEARFSDVLRKLRVDFASEVALLSRPAAHDDAATAARSEFGAVFAMCESGTTPLRRLLPPLETLLRGQRGSDHAVSMAALTVLDVLVNMDADCLRVVCGPPARAPRNAPPLEALLRDGKMATVVAGNARLLTPVAAAAAAAAAAASSGPKSALRAASSQGTVVLSGGSGELAHAFGAVDDVACEYLTYALLNFKELLVKQSPLVPLAVRFLHSVAWRADTAAIPHFRTLFQSCVLQHMFTPRNDGTGHKRVLASHETRWLALRLARLLLVRHADWHADVLYRVDPDSKRCLLDTVALQLDTATASTQLDWFASTVRSECVMLLDAVQTAASGIAGCILNEPLVGANMRTSPFEIVLTYTNALLRKIESNRARPDQARTLDLLVAQARALLRVLQAVEASNTPSPTSQLLNAIRNKAASLRSVLNRDTAAAATTAAATAAGTSSTASRKRTAAAAVASKQTK